MPYSDKTLRCVECGAEFVWTAGEQEFYATKHLQHEPRRCRACKAHRGTERAQPAAAGHAVEAEAVCSSCGRVTTVPFKPAPGRPVFCRSCLQQRRGGRAGHF